MALKVVTESVPGGSLVCAEGEVDLYSSPQLRDAIMAAVSQSPSEVRVELSGVSYMDSSGVATLVEGLKAVGKAGKFALVAPSPAVLKVLKLARLDTVFTIRDERG